MMIPKIIVIGAVTVFAIVGLAPTTGTDAHVWFQDILDGCASGHS